MKSNGKLLLDDLISREQKLIAYKGGGVDWRRYLDREFPTPLKVVHGLHNYPGYKQPSGEQWLHWHDYYEIVIVVSGGGTYQCGHHRFDFSAGDVIIVDPLKMHGLSDWTKAHVALCIFFHADAVAPQGSPVDQGYLASFDDRRNDILPILRAEDCSNDLYLALLRLSQVLRGEVEARRKLIATRFHLLEVLFHLSLAFDSGMQSAPDTLEIRAIREERLRGVLEYIARHISQTIPQAEVARIAGMSVSRFRVFFKDTTGWGFSQYLLEWRVHQAAKLLRESNTGIAEIAQATGFSDQSHLHRAFKKKHEISPLAYPIKARPRDAEHGVHAYHGQCWCSERCCSPRRNHGPTIIPQSPPQLHFMARRG